MIRIVILLGFCSAIAGPTFAQSDAAITSFVRAQAWTNLIGNAHEATDLVDEAMASERPQKLRALVSASQLAATSDGALEVLVLQTLLEDSTQVDRLVPPAEALDELLMELNDSVLDAVEGGTLDPHHWRTMALHLREAARALAEAAGISMTDE